MDALLVRYSEIGLKGKNRGSFERRLLENIREYMKMRNIPFKSVSRMEGRIVIHTSDGGDFLKNIFGVHSYSKCIKVETELESIKNEAVKSVMVFPEGSKFRVTVQRIFKDFPLETTELQKVLGSEIQKNRKLVVSLKDYDYELGVDLLSKFSYIWNEKILGPGGLPTGIEGRVLCVLENKDSIEAAKLVMKRGCEVLFAGKDKSMLKELEKYFFKEPKFFKLADFKQIDEIANQNKVYAVVLGERLHDMKRRETSFTLLRPLIGK